MTEKKRMTLGGSLETAMNGQYQLDVKAVFKEGWSLTQLTKWRMVQAILLVFCIFLIASMVLVQIAQFHGLDVTSSGVQMVSQLMLTLISAPLMTGLIMMGVNHAIGGISKPSHLFHFLPKTLVLALAAMLVGILVQLGLLLILPGLYFIVACSFVMPLIVEKGLPPLRAIYVSIRVVTHKWKEFILLHLVFLGLFLLVALTFGVALIWVAPLYYNVTGILYRDIFGVTVTTYEADPSGATESIFHA
ncbi:hypothetical protein P2G88_16535 [Aliiglaciecola sp. CAU 1673]|uniref:hypothetical protein n=1 Tax=Aliiglaciecola sp. CAU 1673 TaxID=3032595 RepID=UPI0023DC1745|nr:hypothetical protein [Aliiglaciecola sp. CAU 1673]MDF2179861.1 hypothetical protein [Aliiglaciecola sp. CAU 1673]